MLYEAMQRGLLVTEACPTKGLEGFETSDAVKAVFSLAVIVLAVWMVAQSKDY